MAVEEKKRRRVPERVELKIKSRKQNIAIARDCAMRVASGIGFKGEDCREIALAVDEGVSNVIEHAYQDEPGHDLILKFLSYDDRLVILIRDFGKRADLSQIKSRELDEVREGGLGVYIMQTLMDEVEYGREYAKGTQLKLIKYLDSSKSTLAYDPLQQAVEGSDRDEGVNYEDLLSDPTTGFPTIYASVKHIRDLLSRWDRLGLIYINLARYGNIEELYGWRDYDEVLKATANALGEVKESLLGPEDIVAVSQFAADDFVIVLSPEGRGEPAPEMIAELSEKIEIHLNDSITGRLDVRFPGGCDLFTGSSYITNDYTIRLERNIYRALREAAAQARLREDRFGGKRAIQLRDIIEKNALEVLYQPIVGLKTKEVLGYEAFSRGPAGSSFGNTRLLFTIAEENQLSDELEELCLRNSLSNLNLLDEDKHIFVNLEHHAVVRGMGKVIEILGDTPPKRVVIEVSEGNLIRHFSLYQDALSRLQEKGYRIAIDDVGSSYASLSSLAKFSPDILKFDVSLTHNIDQDQLKRSLLETIIKFASEIESDIIAEGIETAPESETLVGLGVEYGQGYFFSPPGPPFPIVSQVNTD